MQRLLAWKSAEYEETQSVMNRLEVSPACEVAFRSVRTGGSSEDGHPDTAQQIVSNAQPQDAEACLALHSEIF